MQGWNLKDLLMQISEQVFLDKARNWENLESLLWETECASEMALTRPLTAVSLWFYLPLQSAWTRVIGGLQSGTQVLVYFWYIFRELTFPTPCLENTYEITAVNRMIAKCCEVQGDSSLKHPLRRIGRSVTTSVRQNCLSPTCLLILNCIWNLPVCEAKTCLILLTCSQHDQNWACIWFIPKSICIPFWWHRLNAVPHSSQDTKNL